MSDEKFQELCRVLDATMAEINPSGLPNGFNALKIIKFLFSFDGMEKFLSNEFQNCINEQLKHTDTKTNIREHIKKIYTYPRVGYLPLESVNINKDTINQLQQELSAIEFTMKLCDGKIYAMPLYTKYNDIKDIIYDKLYEFLPDKNVCRNSEKSHITVVNSNVVYDCGIESVVEFLGNYSELFTVEIGNVNTTVSEDWPVFSRCYMVEIKCKYVDNFVNDFNKRFNKQIKISKHMTFAIIPRSLFSS